MNIWPPYLSIPASELGRGQPVKVITVGDAPSLAQLMAEEMLAEILRTREEGREPTLIVPVGPVDQYPILARLLNERNVSCRDAVFINMDEYLGVGDTWVSEEHPLSFHGYMNRCFYGRVEAALAPWPANRVFPDPQSPWALQQLIDSRGGVDACFGGIGISGHIAFNEPPEPREKISANEFVSLPTRLVTLARETRTINSVTVGGEPSILPKRAVTVGMKEILSARRLRFFCNRHWQSAVVRRMLHGPISPECPASFLRTHADAALTITDFVALTPDIRLR